MRKGIIFSMDVMFAAIVAALFIAAFYYFLNREEDVYPKLYLEKVASDAVTVLDKSGTLRGFNRTNIRYALLDMLPDNFGWQLNLSVYNSTGLISRQPNITMLVKYPYSAIADEQDFIRAERSSVKIENNEAKYFSLAEIKLWIYSPTEETAVAYAKNATYTHNGVPQTWFTTQIQSSDNNYAYVYDVNNYDAIEVYFDSLDIPTDAKITQVKFEVEYRTNVWTSESGSGWRDDFEIYNNGWVYVSDWGSDTNNVDRWWNSTNVVNIINTPEKANNIRVKLEADPLGTGTYSYFDTVRVVVKYK